jgi:hypothetical protein
LKGAISSDMDRGRIDDRNSSSRSRQVMGSREGGGMGVGGRGGAGRQGSSRIQQPVELTLPGPQQLPGMIRIEEPAAVGILAAMRALGVL